MDNKKIITLSFMVAGVLAGIVVHVFLEIFSTNVAFIGRALSSDILAHGIPVVVGLATFAALQFNKNVLVWADEVVVEMKKVVWPSRKDTVATTIFVCILVLISGVLLGFFDWASTWLVKKISTF